MSTNTTMPAPTKTRTMAEAFNEWMRRFREEPERFAREFETMEKFVSDEKAGKEPSYGETCAKYLTALMAGTDEP